eukprot:m51a1_g13821 hypothetical protein (1224) ;mRNA; r:431378-436175
MVVVPVALWNGAPSHNITAVVSVDSHVFTGASSGEICLWAVDDEEQRLVPTILMVGNESAVVALAAGSSKHNTCVVSLTRSASLKVWAASDGRFLGECYEMPQMLSLALAMTALPDGRSVAVGGASHDIFLVDLSSRSVTGVVRGSSDWVVYLCAPLATERTAPLFVSAAQDGSVTLWSHPPAMPYIATATSASSSMPAMQAATASSASYASVLEQPSLVHPMATVGLQDLRQSDGSIMAAAISPDSQFVAIVTRIRWALVAKSKGVNVLEVPPPMISFLNRQESGAPEAEQLWAGGSFLDARRFLAWTEAGVGCFYSIEIEDGTWVAHLTHCTEPPRVSPPHPSSPGPVERASKSPPVAPPSQMHSVVACLRGSVFASATGNSVSMWRISLPRYSSVDNTDSASESQASPVVVPDDVPAKLEALTPAASGCFTNAWATLDDRSSVTCTCVLEDILVMICGHQNGEISSSILPTDPFPKRVAAHAKRVTALMAPHPSVSSTTRYLVSAGDDCCIKVWEMFSFELKHSFAMHSAPILRLIPVAPQSAFIAGDSTSSLKHSFLSIGADRCIGIFSLDTFQSQHWLSGHPAPITAIRWKAERDYMLVSCADTSLCVWELSSGRLITQLSGVKAKEAVTNYCFPVYIARRAFDASQPAEDLGITSAMITVGEAPCSAPVQVLLLNVRQLSHQLDKTSAPPSTIQRKFACSSKSRPVSGIQTPSQPAFRMSQPPQPEEISRAVDGARQGSNVYRFPPFSVLAYLVPWGLDETTDGFCRRELFLRPPSPFGTLGLCGENGNMALVLPAVGSESGAAFKHSHHLSGSIALSAVTLSKTLLSRKDNANTFSHLMTFYCAILPEIAKGFVEPSLPFLTNFWNDALPDVQQSARSIFNATLDRMSPTALRDFSNIFRKFLQSKGEGEHTLAFRVLSIVGAEKSVALDKELARTVTNELLKSIMQDANPMTSCSVEVFAHGFALWKQHLEDPRKAVQRLFYLAMDKAHHATAAKAASHALVQIAAQETRTVISMLDAEIVGHHNQAAAIGFLKKVTRKWNKDVVPHLPLIVETFVHALDPAAPTIRDKCLKPATQVIQGLMQSYPMVTFNMDVQRLAVGTTSAIIVFDIKTATPWVTFQTGVPVLAAAFPMSGKALAAYCADAKVYVWYLSSLFSHFKSLFVMSTVDVTIPISGGIRTYSEGIKLYWTSSSQLYLEGVRSGSTAPVALSLEKSA